MRYLPNHDPTGLVWPGVAKVCRRRTALRDGGRERRRTTGRPPPPATPARGVAEAPRSRAAPQGRRVANRSTLEVGGAAAHPHHGRAVTRPTAGRCDGRRAPADCRPTGINHTRRYCARRPPWASALRASRRACCVAGSRSTSGAADACPGGYACGPSRPALKRYRKSSHTAGSGSVGLHLMRDTSASLDA